MSKHPKHRKPHGFGKGPDGKIAKLGEAPKAPAPGQRRAMTEKETLAARLIAVRTALMRKNNAIRELTLENARMVQALAEARAELLTIQTQAEEQENASAAKRYGLPTEFRFYEEEEGGKKVWYVENTVKTDAAAVPPSQVGKKDKPKRPASPPPPDEEDEEDLDDEDSAEDEPEADDDEGSPEAGEDPDEPEADDDEGDDSDETPAAPPKK